MSKRLFFAACPDKQAQEKIFSMQAELEFGQARPVQRDNFHLTLVFIGQADEHYQDCVCSAAADIESEAFEISFDRLGYFKKPKVLWLGAKQCPEALMSLVSNMQQAFLNCGYQVQHPIYTPHISLFRKASKVSSMMTIDPVCFFVKEFFLFESIRSDRGVVYKKLQRYPLR